MITKPDLTKALVKEYDKLIDLFSRHVDKHDYYEDRKLHRQQGRVDAFKECILGLTEEEQQWVE